MTDPYAIPLAWLDVNARADSMPHPSRSIQRLSLSHMVRVAINASPHLHLRWPYVWIMGNSVNTIIDRVRELGASDERCAMLATVLWAWRIAPSNTLQDCETEAVLIAVLDAILDEQERQP